MSYEHLPTIFRGVFFDAQWEFDAPCVMYEPYARYGIGGNSGHFDLMVEEVCIDLSLGKQPDPNLSAGDAKEFAWRGWSLRGMKCRKNAWHITIEVKWSEGEDGPDFEFVNRTETFGPHKKEKTATP